MFSIGLNIIPEIKPLKRSIEICPPSNVLLFLSCKCLHSCTKYCVNKKHDQLLFQKDKND